MAAPTVLTIEIATLLKAGLVAVVPQAVSVYADGVKNKATPTGDKVTLPALTIQPSECLPMQYKSRQCAFPVTIELTTWNPADTAQIMLYEVGSVVGQYLGTASLALTLGTFDAIIIDNLPERADIERLQILHWEAMVHVLRPAT
jgi:hypothetical protein